LVFVEFPVPCSPPLLTEKLCTTLSKELVMNQLDLFESDVCTCPVCQEETEPECIVDPPLKIPIPEQYELDC
jgi:hypothetical protein